MMNSKEYVMPNGKKVVFEYDIMGVGKITLECMDELMSMITDRPQGEWIEMYRNGFGNMICMCSKCNFHATKSNYCPNCGAKMKGADDGVDDV